MGRRNWKDHPELVRLRENVRKRKVSAEEIAEIKMEIQEQRKVVPVVRVVEDKPFNPAMTIWLTRARYRGVYPVLSKSR